MRVLKTRWFARWARREGLTDTALRFAVDEMRRGLVDAVLGGGLVKKRIARPGGGKSGGYRTLLAADFRHRWVFLYGFVDGGVRWRTGDFVRLSLTRPAGCTSWV